MPRIVHSRAGLCFVALLAACAADADPASREGESAGPDAAIDATASATPSAVIDAGSLIDAHSAPREDDEYVSTGLKITDAAIAAILALDAATLGNQQARCDEPVMSTGIGLACTSRGGQCPTGLTCTAQFRGDAGICTKLGCGSTPGTCGSAASCCTLLQAGGVSLCFPDSCLPTTCLEAFQ